MLSGRFSKRAILLGLTALIVPRLCAAQATPATEPPPAQPSQPVVHDHSGASGWSFMQDGILFATYNRQGGDRRSTDFRSQNWWMGSADRSLGPGDVSFTVMLSLEPATVGNRGYAELFQLGETYQGLANTDHQHPHDFLMQASVAYRFRLGDRAGLTFAAAPVGDAALGPIAFMHRASAAENPAAPLSHHTFDSSHITNGVITVAVDLAPLTLEGSVFHGSEPDEQRWDLMDPGPLDSWSTRLWFVRGRWSAQVSYGSLNEPERLERIDVHRTTASLSWTREQGDNFTSLTGVVGQNVRAYDTLHAGLIEATHHVGRHSVYGRVERVEVESEHLLFPLFVHRPHPGELVDPVWAFTVGGVRDFLVARGFAFGIGSDLTLHRVPDQLRSTYATTQRPYGVHVFFRLRPPASSMGRMWNMSMGSHLRGHRR